MLISIWRIWNVKKITDNKKIKDVLSKNTYPPNFSPEKWKNVKANCYAYALDIAVNDKRQEVWIPGCICDKKTKKGVWNSVTYNIKKDLDFLGILYRENDSYLKEGEYRIAIYYK